MKGCENSSDCTSRRILHRAPAAFRVHAMHQRFVRLINMIFRMKLLDYL